MSEPFLAEIRIMSFNFAPRGWAQCDGQLLQISQNQALYSLLGTTYGGNGVTSFALPDLRGRLPLHFMSPGYSLGQKAGAETHTLTKPELPRHTHPFMASSQNANQPTSSGAILATVNNAYGPPDGALTGIGTGAPSLTATGSQAHDNMMPFQTLNFCIALQGIFPSQN